VEHLLAAYPEEERKSMRVRHHLFLRERDAGWTYDMNTTEAETAFPWLHDYWTPPVDSSLDPPEAKAWRKWQRGRIYFSGCSFAIDRSSAFSS
jgi:hypothetical protein